MEGTYPLGGSTVAAPSHVPSPVVSYKNRGGNQKRKGGTERKKRRERPKDRERERIEEREERREEKRREEKERKRKKNRQQRKKKTQRKKEEKLPATVPPPPASPPLQVSPPPFLFCLHFFPRHARRAQCTSAGGEKLVTVLMHSNQLMWAGSSPAHVVGLFGPAHVFGLHPAHFK
jgi:hypothetical protein